MLTIVEDAAPNETAAEQIVKAKAWARVLFGIIPEERLPDAFAHAFRRHKSNFSINHYDLKNAWEDLREIEAAAAEKAIEAERKDEPWKFCPDEGLHVAGSKGLRKILNLWTDEDEIVPCIKCRADEYEKWHKSQVAMYGEIHPLTKLQRQTRTVIYLDNKDPLAILYRAKDQLNQEMLAAIGTSEYDQLFGGWKMVLDAIAYVRAEEAREKEKE